MRVTANKQVQPDQRNQTIHYQLPLRRISVDRTDTGAVDRHSIDTTIQPNKHLLNQTWVYSEEEQQGMCVGVGSVHLQQHDSCPTPSDKEGPLELQPPPLQGVRR